MERFFAKITLEVIRRGSFTSVPQLRNAITDYIAAHNKKTKPFIWTATVERIFEKIEGVCRKLA